jgi:hypothetical protein
LLLLPNGAPPPAGSEEEKIYALITELLDMDTRETALLELSKKREMYEDLALVLWGGFGGSRTLASTNNADGIWARYHVELVTGDCQCLSGTVSTELDCTCFE